MHVVTPMFAEIADKMPTLETVWTVWLVVGLVGAAITSVLSFKRLWLGGIAIPMSFALGLLAAWPESMDEEIIRELGVGYLWHQRLSSFVPCALVVVTWVAVWLVRRPNHAMHWTPR